MEKGGYALKETDKKDQNPYVLKVRKMKESDVIGFEHDDYTDAMEIEIHPKLFKDDTSEEWLGKAFWRMVGGQSNSESLEEAEKDEGVEQ